MIIRGIKLRAVTENGDFGFDFRFARNLTIIRAKNSSGKSTLFNSLLYGLGMEELVGGKGERILPYAVKDYFEYGGQRVLVATSEVLLEIENKSGRVITLRRAIRDTVKDSKLIEVFECAHLTAGDELVNTSPTYVHDAGGAQKNEGFHRFLESFLELNLPRVATTSGGEAKLYLQTIFAALAVEQKRGWTDYIANIPFYGIRDARARVVDFLLGLGVFETNATKNRLNSESVQIDNDWRRALGEFQREASSLGVLIEGVSAGPSALFTQNSGRIRRLYEGSTVPLGDYISQLRGEYSALNTKSEQFSRVTGEDALKDMAAVTAELQHLSVVHERAMTSLGDLKASLKEYETLLREASEDLDRNKTAAKLRDLGAKYDIELSSGRCPTCHQELEDTLLVGAITGPQMDLAANIAYLDSQRRMLHRQVSGVRESIRATETRGAELAARLAGKRDQLVAMRGDVSSGASESKAIVRRQVQIEVEVEALERLAAQSAEVFDRLFSIAQRLKNNQAARVLLPKNAYTSDDETRISVFQKQFRANAGSFGYESARIQDVEISKDALVPCLAQLELREIRTDIKSDSSASDFVRLIWSYLLALHQTSIFPTTLGNHPNLLMLDEPGQHSMAVDSQHALLKQLASETKLQSIVAASFDETEEVFLQATAGIDFRLIEWSGKLLRPL